MGNFSYMCLISGEQIREGMPVHLFLLKDGKVAESMFGNYDGYGRVMGPVSETLPNGYEVRNSIEWKNGDDWIELHFNDNPKDGMAAILDSEMPSGCNVTPSQRSADDPNQGFLMCGCDDDCECMDAAEKFPIVEHSHKLNFMVKGE